MIDKYRITSKFGNRNDPFEPSQKEFHTGIDIVNDTDLSLYAFINGFCRRARWGNFGEGKYIQTVTDIHGIKYYTNYFHNQENWIIEGDLVQIGDKIGIQGQTGYSKGIHTHLEIFTMSYNMPNDDIKYFMRNRRYKIIAKRIFFDPQYFFESYMRLMNDNG